MRKNVLLLCLVFCVLAGCVEKQGAGREDAHHSGTGCHVVRSGNTVSVGVNEKTVLTVLVDNAYVYQENTGRDGEDTYTYISKDKDAYLTISRGLKNTDRLHESVQFDPVGIFDDVHGRPISRMASDDYTSDTVYIAKNNSGLSANYVKHFSQYADGKWINLSATYREQVSPKSGAYDIDSGIVSDGYLELFVKKARTAFSFEYSCAEYNTYINDPFKLKYKMNMDRQGNDFYFPDYKVKPHLTVPDELVFAGYSTYDNLFGAGSWQFRRANDGSEFVVYDLFGLYERPFSFLTRQKTGEIVDFGFSKMLVERSGRSRYESHLVGVADIGSVPRLVFISGRYKSAASQVWNMAIAYREILPARFRSRNWITRDFDPEYHRYVNDFRKRAREILSF